MSLRTDVSEDVSSQFNFHYIARNKKIVYMHTMGIEAENIQCLLTVTTQRNQVNAHEMLVKLNDEMNLFLNVSVHLFKTCERKMEPF